MDKVPSAIQNTYLDVRNIAGDLLHPSTVRLLENTYHFNPAGLKVEDEKYEVADQSGAGEYLDAKAFGCDDSAPMSFERRSPRHSLAANRGGIEPVVEQGAFDDHGEK